MRDGTFWLILVIACLFWYSTVTVYVAYRGIFDIRTMLARLGAGGDEDIREDTAESDTTSRSDSP